MSARYRLRTLSILSACITIAACGASSASTPPASVPAPPVTPAAPAADPAVLQVRVDSTTRRYSLENRTAVFALPDTSAVLDSIVLSGTVAISAARDPSGTVRMRGRVERMTVSTGLGPDRVSLALTDAVSLVWNVAPDGNVTIEGATSDACDQLENTARDVLLTAAVAVPDSVVAASAWTARYRVSSCRGGVTVNVETQGRYTIPDFVSAVRTARVPLRWEGRSTVSGRGVQGATSVSLRGSGVMLSMFDYDAARGFLRSSNSSGTLTLEFDLGYRTDRFLQRTMRRFTLID